MLLQVTWSKLKKNTIIKNLQYSSSKKLHTVRRIQRRTHIWTARPQKGLFIASLACFSTNKGKNSMVRFNTSTLKQSQRRRVCRDLSNERSIAEQKWGNTAKLGSTESSCAGLHSKAAHVVHYCCINNNVVARQQRLLETHFSASGNHSLKWAPRCLNRFYVANLLVNIKLLKRL